MSTSLASFDSLVTTRYFLPNEDKSFEEHRDDRANLQKKNVQKNINYSAKKVRKKKKRGHGHAIIKK